MNKRLTISAIALLIPGPFTASAEASRPAKQISVALDRSTSNPLTKSQKFAVQAGNLAANKIWQSTIIGDRVSIFKIGERGSNSLTPDVLYITRKNRPKHVGITVGRAIANIPNDTALHQNTTSILYALERSNIPCHAESELLLFSDGMETGPEAKLSEIVSGASSFRAPASEYLKGCKVTMIGVGLDGNLTTEQTENLIEGWRTYFQTAGAQPNEITIRSFP